MQITIYIKWAKIHFSVQHVNATVKIRLRFRKFTRNISQVDFLNILVKTIYIFCLNVCINMVY